MIPSMIAQAQRIQALRFESEIRILMIQRVLFTVALVLLPLSVLVAQGSQGSPVDSLRPLPQPDQSLSDDFVMTKSPTTAVLLTFAAPGLGQLYTEQYWKIPLFAAPAGFFAWRIIDNNSQFNDYNSQLQGLDPRSSTYFQIRTLREEAREDRDLSIAYLVGVYLLAAVDAYTGAHLYDFDVGEDLSGLYFAPPVEGIGVGIGVRW